MTSCKKFRSAQYQGMYRQRPNGPCAECVYFSQKNCGMHYAVGAVSAANSVGTIGAVSAANTVGTVGAANSVGTIGTVSTTNAANAHNTHGSAETEASLQFGPII